MKANASNTVITEIIKKRPIIIYQPLNSQDSFQS